MTEEGICGTDVDIYGDLPDFKYGEQLEKLEKENLSLTKKVLDLKSELCKAIEEKSKFEAQTKTLSTNITSLYKTAIAEIKRKDRTINELWKKNYSLTFGTKTTSNYSYQTEDIFVDETVQNSYQENEEITVQEIFSTQKFDDLKESKKLNVKPNRKNEGWHPTEYSRRMHKKFFNEQKEQCINTESQVNENPESPLQKADRTTSSHKKIVSSTILDDKRIAQNSKLDNLKGNDSGNQRCLQCDRSPNCNCNQKNLPLENRNGSNKGTTENNDSKSPDETISSRNKNIKSIFDDDTGSNCNENISSTNEPSTNLVDPVQNQEQSGTKQLTDKQTEKSDLLDHSLKKNETNNGIDQRNISIQTSVCNELNSNIDEYVSDSQRIIKNNIKTSTEINKNVSKMIDPASSEEKNHSHSTNILDYRRNECKSSINEVSNDYMKNVHGSAKDKTQCLTEKNNDTSLRDDKNNSQWVLIKVDSRHVESRNSVTDNHIKNRSIVTGTGLINQTLPAPSTPELQDKAVCSNQTSENRDSVDIKNAVDKSHNSNINNPTQDHTKPQIVTEVPTFHSKLLKKSKSKPLFNPISHQWNSQSLIHNHEKDNKDKSIPAAQVTDEKILGIKANIKTNVRAQRNSLLESLFGSPLKWSDTDSVDCHKLDVSSPAIYEDSCSAQLENPRFRTPLDSNCKNIHNASTNKNSAKEDTFLVQSKASVNLDIEKSDILAKKYCVSENKRTYSQNKLVTDKVLDSEVSTSNHMCQHVSAVEIKETKKNYKAYLNDKTPIKAKYDDSLLGQFEDTNQLISALTKVHTTISPINTPQKEEKEVENFSASETLNVNMVLEMNSVLQKKGEESTISPQPVKDSTNCCVSNMPSNTKEINLNIETSEMADPRAQNTEHSSIQKGKPLNSVLSSIPTISNSISKVTTNDSMPKINILQPRKTPRNLQATKVSSISQKISAFPQHKFDELSFTKGFLAVKEAAKNNLTKNAIYHSKLSKGDSFSGCTKSGMDHEVHMPFNEYSYCKDYINEAKNKKNTSSAKSCLTPSNIQSGNNMKKSHVISKSDNKVTTERCSTEKKHNFPISFREQHRKCDNYNQSKQKRRKTVENKEETCDIRLQPNKSNTRQPQYNHSSNRLVKRSCENVLSVSPKKMKLMPNKMCTQSEVSGRSNASSNSINPFTSVEKKRIIGNVERNRRIERPSKPDFSTENNSSKASVIEGSPLKFGQGLSPQNSGRNFLRDKLNSIIIKQADYNNKHDRYDLKSDSSRNNRLFSAANIYSCNLPLNNKKNEVLFNHSQATEKKKCEDLSNGAKTSEIKSEAVVKGDERTAINGNEGGRSRVIIRTTKKIHWTTTTTVVIQKCLSESENANKTNYFNEKSGNKGTENYKSNIIRNGDFKMQSDSIRTTHSRVGGVRELAKGRTNGGLMNNTVGNESLKSSIQGRDSNDFINKTKMNNPERIIIRNKNRIHFSENM